MPQSFLPPPTPTPAPTVAPTPTPDPDVVTFPNGHTVRGALRRFWQEHDGAVAFGMPLTEPVWIDGRFVQHFERARFEQTADGAVVLGAVGAEGLAARGIDPQPAPAQPGCRFFEATQQNLCEPFLTFWQQRGGEALLGAPLTGQSEQLRTKIQWFERARLEQPLGRAIEVAALGNEALGRVPAHQVLRTPGLVAAPQRATLQRLDQPFQPLETVRAVLETEPITTTAALFWGDTQGNFWPATASIMGGRAEATNLARGALGAQGVVILINGKVAGVTTDVYRLDAASAITTGQPRFDELIPRVKAFMDQDISEYRFGDNLVRGYRSPDNNMLWLRDHVHQGKGYAYWERDMTSLLDQFRRYQRADGSFDDYLASYDWGEIRGRKEVEADLEYLFIEGVYRAWQATGDDEWLRQQIVAMERGLRYAMTDPLRWDATNRLIKRPYTIDTWDFEIGQPTVSPDGKIAPRHWIDDQTKWCIFYGDNTGYANAMELLARMYTRLGNPERAAYWRGEAQGLLERLNALAWNGRFYRHMVPLAPVAVPVDPAAQLSLSNAYALNRAGITQAQAESIITEYQQRRRPADQAFAEWYSIDPPFPAGTTSIPETGAGNRPGEYVNGGIMPLVGGELARGAFAHGFETYGFDILQRYYNLIAGTGASYLWYYPQGQPGISGADTLPTDGWGSSAMLAGLIEGAAGVRDDATTFTEATLAPRWSATPDVSTATVVIRYGASNGYIAYRWQRDANGLRLTWTGSGQAVNVRLLLPTGVPETARATLNGQPVAIVQTTLRDSRYAELKAQGSGAMLLAW